MINFIVQVTGFYHGRNNLIKRSRSTVTNIENFKARYLLHDQFQGIAQIIDISHRQLIYTVANNPKATKFPGLEQTGHYAGVARPVNDMGTHNYPVRM